MEKGNMEKGNRGKENMEKKEGILKKGKGNMGPPLPQKRSFNSLPQERSFNSLSKPHSPPKISFVRKCPNAPKKKQPSYHKEGEHANGSLICVVKKGMLNAPKKKSPSARENDPNSSVARKLDFDSEQVTNENISITVQGWTKEMRKIDGEYNQEEILEVLRLILSHWQIIIGNAGAFYCVLEFSKKLDNYMMRNCAQFRDKKNPRNLFMSTLEPELLRVALFEDFQGVVRKHLVHIMELIN